MHDLKERTLRGGFARFGALGATFILRMGAIMALARLLSPKDFGLVGMVAAFTGALGFLRDFGLSTAAVQTKTISQEQSSTLFWINVLVGALLGIITLSAAPAISSFYGEPRLSAIAAALALGFLFNAAGTQHAALLQREMRWNALAAISVVSLLFGTAIGIGSAAVGYGYWALVWMTISAPLFGAIGLWLATGWVPGLPRMGVGVRPMVLFGSTLTLRTLISYVAYNADKVLIGRFWGADAIGIYGRAYQLVNIPADNLNSAFGELTFAALSRLQDDSARLRRYFLTGFSLVLELTLPVTLICALFAEDVVWVLLGPKWHEAAPLVRLLAPAIVIYSIITPLECLILAKGLSVRSLKISLIFAPYMILAYLVGLPFGVRGVGLAYSGAMAAWLIPHTLMCVRGTVISMSDIVLAVSRPMTSGIVAGSIALAFASALIVHFSPVLRLALESGILLVSFFMTLFLAAERRSFYLTLLRALRPSSLTDIRAAGPSDSVQRAGAGYHPGDRTHFEATEPLGEGRVDAHARQSYPD